MGNTLADSHSSLPHDLDQINHLQDSQTGQPLIARTLSSFNQVQAEQLADIIHRKMSTSCPYVTKLKHSLNQEVKQVCSSYHLFTMAFDNPGHTLLDELEKRERSKVCFDWLELELILQSVVKGLKYFHEVRHPYQNLSLSCIFVTPKQNILLGDPWLNLGSLFNAYASPERKMYAKDQIQSYDNFKSCLYEAAQLILSLAPLSSIPSLINESSQQIYLRSKLDFIPHLPLRQKLQVLTNLDPDKRTLIYSLYLPQKNHVVSAKSKKAKQMVTFQKYATPQNTKIQRNSIASRFSSRGRNTESSIIGKLGYESVSSKQKNKSKSKNQKVSSFHKNSGQLFASFNTNYNGLGHNLSSQESIFFSNEIGKSGQTEQNQFRERQQASGIQARVQTSMSVSPTLISEARQQNDLFVQNRKQEPISLTKSGEVVTKNKKTEQIYSHPQISTMEKQKNNKIPQKMLNLFKIQSNQNKEQYFIEATTPFFKKEFEKNQSQPPHLENTIGFNEIREIEMTLENEKSGKSPKKSFIYIQEQNEQESLKDDKQITIANIKNQRFLNSESAVTEKNMIYPQQIETMGQKESKIKNRSQKISPVCFQVSEIDSRSKPQTPIYQKQLLNTSQISIPSKNDPNFTQPMAQKNGDGVFDFVDGSYFKGTLKAGLPHGYGHLFYQNGRLSYEGNWSKGKFEGIGKYYPNKEADFEGKYGEKDLSEAFNFWTKYQGEFKKGKMSGKGKVKFSNGQYFIGNFAFGKAEGEGTYFKKTGATIKGVWRNNKMKCQSDIK